MRPRHHRLVTIATLLAASVSTALAGPGAGAGFDAAVEVEAVVEVRVEVAPEVVRVASPPPVVATASTTGWGTAGTVPLERPHWEVGLAMTVPLGAGDLGVHAAAGRQVGPVRLAAEYTLTAASGDRDRAGGVVLDCGQRQRLGLAARYRLGVGTPEVATGLFVEGGLGLVETRWQVTGAARQRDAMAGLGVELAAGRARLAGLDVGARVTIAARDTAGAPREVTGLLLVGLLVGG